MLEGVEYLEASTGAPEQPADLLEIGEDGRILGEQQSAEILRSKLLGVELRVRLPKALIARLDVCVVPSRDAAPLQLSAGMVAIALCQENSFQQHRLPMGIEQLAQVHAVETLHRDDLVHRREVQCGKGVDAPRVVAAVQGRKVIRVEVVDERVDGGDAALLIAVQAVDEDPQLVPVLIEEPRKLRVRADAGEKKHEMEPVTLRRHAELRPDVHANAEDVPGGEHFLDVAEGIEQIESHRDLRDALDEGVDHELGRRLAAV